MLGTRDHAGIALAAKLDSLIRDQEQHAGVLAKQLAQAMHQIHQHRELRVLLDQILDEPSGPQGLVDPTPALGGMAGTSDRTAASITTGVAPVPPTPTAGPDALRSNPAPIEDVYRFFKDRPGQVVPAAEVRHTFPDASTAQISERLGRLVSQGKIDRIDPGRFRFPPQSPTQPHSGSESTEDYQHGTVREQIRMIVRQDPSRGWRPKDLADVVTPKMNDDYLRTMLREMLHHGELMQDNAGLYWAPRPPAIVPAQQEDRQAIVI